jgi:hypothetical protein
MNQLTSHEIETLRYLVQQELDSLTDHNTTAKQLYVKHLKQLLEKLKAQPLTTKFDGG